MIITSVDIPLINLTVQGVEHDPITYYSTYPLLAGGPLPIYATSNDTTIPDDACDPLPDDTPDLSSLAVVVRRGTCTEVAYMRLPGLAFR